MKNMMEYNGYLGSVNYSDDDEIFFGKVDFIQSLVSYEGFDVASLRKSFHEAVDDYLTMCKERGIEPEKPFKRSFNIRPGTDLHRRAAIAAAERGINLNKLVVEALENYLG